MATNERSIELAGVDLAGQNYVCAFFSKRAAGKIREQSAGDPRKDRPCVRSG